MPKNYIIRALLLVPIVLVGAMHAATAQTLSDNDAIKLAEKLFERKILSEPGKNFLIEKIRVEEQREPSLTDHQLTKTSILDFCHLAFWQEGNQRFGTMEVSPSEYRDLHRAAKRYRHDPEAYQKWLDGYNARNIRRMEKLSRQHRKIEYHIPAEDSVLQWFLALPLTKPKTGFPKNPIHESRSVLGKTRTRTARDLFEIGLIDRRVYEDLLKANNDSLVPTESDICYFAARRTEYYSEYADRKSRQLAFLDSLVRHDVMTPVQRQRLTDSYDEYELKDDLEIMAHCKYGLLLDSAGAADLSTYIRKALQQLKSIIVGFNYSDLKISIASPAVPSAKVWASQKNTPHYINISFIANGIKYSRTFNTPSNEKAPEFGMHDLNGRTPAQFYTMINDWLANNRSPYRLYYVAPTYTDFTNYETGDSRVGLILLTERQRALWERRLQSMSHEDHRDALQSREIDDFIQTCASTGILSHLTPTQIDSCRLVVKGKIHRSLFSILNVFPKTLCGAEPMYAADHPYAELIKSLAVVSRGAFIPEGVKDDYKLKSATPQVTMIKFQFAGRPYTIRIPADHESPEEDIVNVVNQSLRENTTSGSFRPVYDGPWKRGYIFLTPVLQGFIEEKYSSLLIRK